MNGAEIAAPPADVVNVLAAVADTSNGVAHGSLR